MKFWRNFDEIASNFAITLKNYEDQRKATALPSPESGFSSRPRALSKFFSMFLTLSLSLLTAPARSEKPPSETFPSHAIFPATGREGNRSRSLFYWSIRWWFWGLEGDWERGMKEGFRTDERPTRPSIWISIPSFVPLRFLYILIKKKKVCIICVIFAYESL